MALQLDTVMHACGQIAREIRDYQKNLTLHYVVHHEGQRTEALGLAAQDILGHPASETAMHFLQKQRRSEESILLGTAVARRNILFGLASRDIILAVCTMNIDQFNSLKEARRHAYHLAWHALDAVAYHGEPRNRTGGATEILVRKRNGLEMAAANMTADIFSCVISSFHRDKDAARRLALMRGMDALHTRSLFSPEFYPFPIAMDAAEYAVGRIDPKQINRKGIVPASLRLAREVAATFDEISIKQWMAFAEPAQDMAWRGNDEATIIGAAINTSPNTYVRAIAYQISELAGLKPAGILKIRENYSAFADEDFNEQLHNRTIDTIYQDIIAQGLKHNSGLPFLKQANHQNAALTEGNVIGWCAPALHAAGEAYDAAKRSGGDPDRHAAQEFAARRNAARWGDLMTLGQRVIKSQRQGSMVTLGDLQDLSRDIEGLAPLRKSVEKTMSDPQYQQKLAAAREMEPALAARPSEPAPRIAPKAPAPAAVPLAAPGFGPGGGRTMRSVSANTKPATGNDIAGHGVKGENSVE